MAEEEEENIFSFRDKTPAPDPTHEYSDTVRDAHTPIIIDNGNKFVRLCRAIKQGTAFSLHVGIYSNEDTMAHTRRLVVTS